MAIEDVRKRLRELDLDKLEAEARANIRSGKKTRREKGVKMLRAITGLKRSGVAPEDLVITKVPVIPPGFRPYTVAGESFLPGDANELYADLIRARNLLDETRRELGPDQAAGLRDYVREAARATYGYGESPNPKIRARKVSGFFQKVVGNNPKTSFVQGKLISKPQDHVGRGVISPDPALGMDQVAIPESMAWDLFGDHVERRLTAQGFPKLRRLKAIRDREPAARAALDKEMGERPVIYSRAPAWHKQNVLAGYAQISKGDNIRISPLTSAGLNADFDGDLVDNQVVTAIPKCLIPDIPKDFLERFQRLGGDPELFEKLHLPYIDPETYEIAIIDLEDFPHSDALIGEKQGENSYIRFFHAVPGTKVVSFDEPTGSLVWADVAGWSIHTSPPIEIVTLSNGLQTFTDDDPRAVYGMDPETGEMGRWTPTEALERKIIVPCGRNLRTAVSDLDTADSLAPHGEAEEPGYDEGRSAGSTCRNDPHPAVPGFLFRAPVGFRRGFLRGAAGDGFPAIEARSSSLRLIRELHALCMTLGMRTSVSGAEGDEEPWILREVTPPSTPEENQSGETITWARVVEVQKTGIRETGYDLTVPGYETFMSADGVILSNTMAVHAPTLPEAVKDAKEKLLPSKMLFSIRDRDSTLPQPKHESLLGLYASQQNPLRPAVSVGGTDDVMKRLENGTLRLDDHVELPE